MSATANLRVPATSPLIAPAVLAEECALAPGTSDPVAVLAVLRARAKPTHVASQQSFGSRPRTEQLGLTMGELRTMAKAHRRDQALALALWAEPIHEARILAALVTDPRQFNPALMDRWIRDFDAWDLCDQVCLNVFRHTPHAFDRVRTWANRQPEFERRAAFALLATLAVHAKQEPDATFLALLPLIERAATDDRNFVKKAVNWALRQIGKRPSPPCHAAALALAEKLATSEAQPARWIGHDAACELRNRT